MTVAARDPYQVTWRDRLAWRLACLALKLGTKRYRAFIKATGVNGLAAMVAKAERGASSNAPSDLAPIATFGMSESRGNWPEST